MHHTFVGGADSWNNYADILKYSDSEGEEKWTKVEEMSKKRSKHAVSIIDFDKFKNHFQ